jgi:hypothetical protein
VKLQQIKREFQTLLDRPKAELFKEMYRTRSTFGANPAVPHGTLASFIGGELTNMEWPLQQGHDALAFAVPQYVAGFTLFHQAPPKPDRDFLHLFFQITESDFFLENYQGLLCTSANISGDTNGAITDLEQALEFGKAQGVGLFVHSGLLIKNLGSYPSFYIGKEEITIERKGYRDAEIFAEAMKKIYAIP